MHTGKLVLISVALLLMSGLKGGALAQTDRVSDQLSGFYQGSAKMPTGSKDINFIVEIKNENGTLSGHVEVEGSQFPLTGSNSHGDVTIKFNPGTDLIITAKAVGDRITGTWSMDGGRSGGVEMKRVSQEWKQIHDLIGRARAEVSQFTGSGGKASDENSPARKWANQLWDYSRQHSGEPEAKKAENEALVLLLGTGLVAEAAARTSPLESSDDVWQRAVMDQLAIAAGNNDYDYVIKNADVLVEQSNRPALKAQIRLAQGDAYWEKGDPAQAKAVFRRVMDENPKTRFAREAAGNIYEIESLNVGQVAPRLESRFVDGHQARLADFKGRPVLLVFWASW